MTEFCHLKFAVNVRKFEKFQNMFKSVEKNADLGEPSTPHKSEEDLKTYRENLLIKAHLGPAIVAQANDMFKGPMLTGKTLTKENLNINQSLTEVASKILEENRDENNMKAYRQALVEQAKLNPAIVEPDNPRQIIVKKMVLLVERRPECFLDLTEDVSKLRNNPFIIKEGIRYRMRIEFIVQRKIINRLYYDQKIKKMGFTVTEKQQMVGSYIPKEEIQSFVTSSEFAPRGAFSRRTYRAHSLFRDSENNQLSKWEWCFKIVKDWKD